MIVIAMLEPSELSDVEIEDEKFLPALAFDMCGYCLGHEIVIFTQFENDHIFSRHHGEKSVKQVIAGCLSCKMRWIFTAVLRSDAFTSRGVLVNNAYDYGRQETMLALINKWNTMPYRPLLEYLKADFAPSYHSTETILNR